MQSINMNSPATDDRTCQRRLCQSFQMSKVFASNVASHYKNHERLLARTPHKVRLFLIHLHSRWLYHLKGYTNCFVGCFAQHSYIFRTSSISTVLSSSISNRVGFNSMLYSQKSVSLLNEKDFAVSFLAPREEFWHPRDSSPASGSVSLSMKLPEHLRNDLDPSCLEQLETEFRRMTLVAALEEGAISLSSVRESAIEAEDLCWFEELVMEGGSRSSSSRQVLS